MKNPKLICLYHIYPQFIKWKLVYGKYDTNLQVLGFLWYKTSLEVKPILDIQRGTNAPIRESPLSPRKNPRQPVAIGDALSDLRRTAPSLHYANREISAIAESPSSRRLETHRSRVHRMNQSKRTAMITRSNLAEQLREYQIRSKHNWATVSFFSSTSTPSSSRYCTCLALASICGSPSFLFMLQFEFVALNCWVYVCCGGDV